MNTATAIRTDQDVRIFTSTVKGRCDNRYMIMSGGAMMIALRAAGCLLQPEPGDTVLSVSNEEGSLYILNVLDRENTGNASHLTVPGGQMVLDGERISIEPRKELNVSTASIELKSGDANASFGRLQARGASLASHFLKISTVARTIETVSEVLLQKSVRCYRKVQEFEEATIGRLRMLVDGLFSVSSRSASLKAEKRFRIDAEKIHLG